MNTTLYAAFLIAAAVLILVPGPTMMFVTSTSMQRGARVGLITVLGSTVAAALQLAVVVGGLASVVTFAGNSFEWIRWAGVVYLVYLGLSAWFSPAAAAPSKPYALGFTSGLRHLARGFLVTLTNPKTLLFHGAFLPQFVDPTLPKLPQMLVLASSFVIIAAVGDSVWALLAAKVGVIFNSARAKRLIDRLSGAVLLGAGVALATIRRTE